MYRVVLAVGLAGQAAFAAPLALVGMGNLWLALIVPSLFFCFFLHVTALVASMVTARSGVPDTEQGIATGLVTMSQQIGLTIGIPIFSAIAATRAYLLTGIKFAVGINTAVVAITAIITRIGLRPRSLLTAAVR